MGELDARTIYVYGDASWEEIKAHCRRLPDTSISNTDADNPGNHDSSADSSGGGGPSTEEAPGDATSL